MKNQEEQIAKAMENYGMSREDAESVVEKEEYFNNSLLERGNAVSKKLRQEIKRRDQFLKAAKILNKNKSK